MNETQLVLAAMAAFFYGRGYYVTTNAPVPGKDTMADLAAVLPRMRELKLRMKRGFAPTGIINHLYKTQWSGLNQLTEKTGYEADFIAGVMRDAALDDWVDTRIEGDQIFYRIKNYRVPTRECLGAFAGTEKVPEKIDLAESLAGCFHRIFFVFPFAVDDQTMARITSFGAGVMQFHRKQGVFQELVPGDSFEIENRKGLEVQSILSIDDKGDKHPKRRIIHNLNSRNLNPAFDVTPNQNITGFITPKGIINQPFDKNIKKLLGK